jgi:predicted RNA-binding protein YlxR (DUF448 family)
MASSPQRTCIACRQRTDQHELIRVAYVNGAIEQLLRGPSQGRSAYCCKTLACFERALNPKALSRALRRSIAEEAIAPLRLTVLPHVNENPA